MRSSARVAPRSVSREAATSATTSSAVNAADSTHPVQVASPIGPEPHRGQERLLALQHRDVRGDRQQHPVALEDRAAVGVVQRGQLDLLVQDVLPDVELGPVGQREHPDVLALAVGAVVEVPQLGPLVARVPLAELVPEAEDPLLGPGLLLVAAGPAEYGVEPVLPDGSEQGGRLQPVAAGPGPGLFDHPARVDVVLDPADHQADPNPGHGVIPELDHLGEVVPGIDVHDRERQRRRPERLGGQVQHDDGVLPSREEQDRPFEPGRHLADDVDRLRFQGAQVGKFVRRRHQLAVSRPITLIWALWSGPSSQKYDQSGRASARFAPVSPGPERLRRCAGSGLRPRRAPG